MIDPLLVKLADIAETEFADVTTCYEIKEGKLRLIYCGWDISGYMVLKTA